MFQPLERLGETDAIASVLRDVLEGHGWETALTRPFAGGAVGRGQPPRVLAAASNGVLDLCCERETATAAMIALAEECGRFSRFSDVQLRLVV